jgi:hypothetical protein
MYLGFLKIVNEKIFEQFHEFGVEDPLVGNTVGGKETYITIAGLIIGIDCQQRCTGLQAKVMALTSEDERFMLQPEILFYSHLEADPPYMEFNGKITVTNSPC